MTNLTLFVLSPLLLIVQIALYWAVFLTVLIRTDCAGLAFTAMMGVMCVVMPLILWLPLLIY